MKLVSYSLTYHNCPVQHRERVALTSEQRRRMLKKIHTAEQISEAVILDTCNRLEFYLYAKKAFNCKKFIEELIRIERPGAVNTWKKYSIEIMGADLVRHLFEVAAGLDSQMIGENQILSQVKAAYRESTDCRTSKLIFHKLFHSAFRVGKAVRTHTNINCGAVSIALAAMELARDKIDLSSTTAMVIGAGENAELVARYLTKSGLRQLIIANRNKVKAHAIASSFDKAEVIGLAQISKRLADVDLLISSTAAIEPVVTYEMAKNNLVGRKRPLLIIDIAVPRDVDPRVARFKCITLINIDDLNKQVKINKKKRSTEIPKAQAIVAEFTNEFMRWYDSLNVVPVISALLEKGAELAHNEARRYAKDFGPDNADKLEYFAESLVKKLLHAPISFIKNGSGELSAEQLQAVDLINKMFLWDPTWRESLTRDEHK
jgi:glutamyl-tRNA reductase